jgi:hypothetical protein
MLDIQLGKSEEKITRRNQMEYYVRLSVSIFSVDCLESIRQRILIRCVNIIQKNKQINCHTGNLIIFSVY